MAIEPNPAAQVADDSVVVFRTQRSNVRGRIVRLGKTLDNVVTPHAMPDIPSRYLSEAIALAALCGSALPDGGNLNFQTRSDGAVSILVADYAAPGRLRGYARYDAGKLGEAKAQSTPLDNGGGLGNGHLAITLDSGPGEERYQGILAFDSAPLAATAAAYFEHREAIPTFIRIAVADQFIGSRQAAPVEPRWHRRAGGLMVQSAVAHQDESDEAREDWNRVQTLAATVEDHELLDPGLSIERLLLRLFHEEAVAIERVIPLSAFCRCSRDKVKTVLLAFGAGELSDMRDDSGQIAVTCEFCTARYLFSLDDLKQASG
jgi:molecular chaperone Hsp33